MLALIFVCVNVVNVSRSLYLYFLICKLQVLCLHGDGDVEVLFPVAGSGAKAFTFAAAHLTPSPLAPALGSALCDTAAA
jgi:hypothetical protein